MNLSVAKTINAYNLDLLKKWLMLFNEFIAFIQRVVPNTHFL